MKFLKICIFYVPYSCSSNSFKFFSRNSSKNFFKNFSISLSLIRSPEEDLNRNVGGEIKITMFIS